MAFQRVEPLPGLSSGLPGEVLLQRHHLPPALLSRGPLPSLHTQMLFNLQLQIIALLDQCLCRCSCRETRKQGPVHRACCNPSHQGWPDC